MMKVIVKNEKKFQLKCCGLISSFILNYLIPCIIINSNDHILKPFHLNDYVYELLNCFNLNTYIYIDHIHKASLWYEYVCELLKHLIV